MIMQFVLILLFGVIGYLFMRYYWLPKRRFQYYSKNLKEQGYKVYQFPFSTFRAPFFQKYETYFSSHGDSLYLQKNEFSKYDIILSNVLDTVFLTIQNVQLIKTFYESDSVYKYIKHQSLSQGLKTILGNGLVFSEKDIWKRKRKIISKSFNFDLLIKNVPTISKITEQTFIELQKEIIPFQNPEMNLQFQPRQLGFRIFSRVILTSFFQTQFQQNKINGIPTCQFLEDLFDQINQHSRNIFVILFGDFSYKFSLTEADRRLKKKLSILKIQVLNLIKEKALNFKQKQNQSLKDQEQTEAGDLLESLLKQKFKGEETFDQTQLQDQFRTFLFAGTDTTTNFLRSIIYYLCKYPLVQEKLRKQINSIIENEEDINISNIKKLTYLQAVQNEVIRMAGPSATCFARIVEKETMLNDIKLEKGTGVLIEPMANHFNQKYFKSPYQFWPQRWNQKQNHIAPYSFTGFFGGPRTCIGKHLAYLQSKIVIIKLLKRYKNISISVGGERMKVNFLYGPQKYLLKVQRHNS